MSKIILLGSGKKNKKSERKMKDVRRIRHIFYFLFLLSFFIHKKQTTSFWDSFIHVRNGEVRTFSFSVILREFIGIWSFSVVYFKYKVVCLIQASGCWNMCCRFFFLSLYSSILWDRLLLEMEVSFFRLPARSSVISWKHQLSST